jgi:uncharacterized surface protein with fasciclin (FAS1) repeats
MKFRPILGSATAGAVLTATALVAAGAAPAQAAPARDLGTTSLAAVLGADGVKFDSNAKDFDIVEAAVYAVAEAKPKSPVLVLADGTKRVTAFVPTDKAFRNLVKDLTGKSYKSEKKVFTKLAGLVDIDTIETVLLYHVVPHASLTAAKALKADGAKLTTAAGVKLKVKVKNGMVKLVDKDPDTAKATVIVPDINKGNKQIAHGIDAVLRPADL